MTPDFIGGIIYTFYSFKGGVGRSMALANAAALLAKRGHKVLVVDWDLEAPGIERFFSTLHGDIAEARATTPGVVDMLLALETGTPLDWRSCLIELKLPTGRLAVISSGRGGEKNASRIQEISFQNLFDNFNAGEYLERQRNDWLREFDFIFVDSRTGLTDIGGICTAQLADVLVLVHTTTESTVGGALDVLRRARVARSKIPRDRARLVAVPLPARDESRTEYEHTQRWRKIFAERFQDVYDDWLPAKVPAGDAIARLSVPYVPYWSFGERLPVLEGDSTGLADSYDFLARLLECRLDWYKALESASARTARGARTSFDKEWLRNVQGRALGEFRVTGGRGRLEIHHYCSDPMLNLDQPGLREAARSAAVNARGWTIGVDPNGYTVQAVNDGIVAKSWQPPGQFCYWALNREGDFYTLLPLPEATHPDNAELYFDTTVFRVAEGLIHAVRLYKALGAHPSSRVSFFARYGGMAGRALNSEVKKYIWTPKINRLVDETQEIEVEFGLDELNLSRTADLAEQLTKPLFVLFEFASVARTTYENIVRELFSDLGEV